MIGSNQRKSWGDTPRATAYVLSNFADRVSADGAFTLRSIAPQDGVLVEVAGSLAEFPEPTEVVKVSPAEPQSASDYDDRTTVAVKAVLIEVGQILGAFKGKFAVVGGAVPWLLLNNEEMPHVGTLDVDLGLNAEAATASTRRWSRH